MTKNAVLYLSGKLLRVAELHASRRAAADVHDRAERVGVVVGPFRRALAEAELRARDDVQDARVAIPRQAHVPLHVAVVGEKLAVGVEVEVVGVAETGGEKLPFFAVGIGGGGCGRRADLSLSKKVATGSLMRGRKSSSA